jgi:hypothetical protein
VAVAGLLVFTAIYVAIMRLSINVSVVKGKAGADYRDGVYLAIHGGLLLAAAIGGFGLGKWLSGLGLAYAVLFLLVLSLVMVGAQLGSYELACAGGHNDLIRRWTC